MQTRRTIGAFAIEIRIGYGLTRCLLLAREENRHLGRVKFVRTINFLRHALQQLIARAQLRIHLRTEHAIRRVVVRRQHVFPVIQPRPTAGFKKRRFGNRQRARIHQRTTAHARAGQDVQMTKKTQTHDARPLECRHPQPAIHLPIGFGEILRSIPAPFFDHQHLVTFFGQTQSADRTTKTTADDDEIVFGIEQVNRAHEVSFLI